MATDKIIPPLPPGFQLDQNDLNSMPSLPSGFELQEKKEILSKKSPLKEVGRHVARSGSRIAESVIGLPSDILQGAALGSRALEKGASKIREKIGLSPLKPENKPKGLPGSQELREFSEKTFGNIVTPQSKTESFIDDIVSDAAVLAIPVKGKIPFIRSIGSAIAANVAGKGVEKLGVGETGQAAAKIGTFFLAGLAGKGNVKKFWNNQYDLAEKSVPKGDKLEAFKLDRQLDKLSSELRKGGIETPSQKFVEKPLRDLQKIISEGELRVEDAIAAKKKINELRAGLFEEVKGKGAQKYARTKINDIAKYLDESIEKYGRENPDFFKHYKAANEAYSGFQQSKKVGQWIKKALPYGKMGHKALYLLEAIFKPAILKSTLPAFGALKTGELLTRMFKNPTLRQYYGNLMKDAINENKVGVLRNLKFMEKEIQKTDPDIFDSIIGVNQ